MNLGRLLALAGLLTATLTASARAASLDALLKLPFSPGSVVLLIEHASDARVISRWREGLTSQDPRVRAATARAVNVGGAATLGPVLLSALAEETDIYTAVEDIRALIMLNVADDLQVFNAARRLGADAVRAYATTMVRVRGASGFERIAFGEADRAMLELLGDSGSQRTSPNLPPPPPEGPPTHTLGELPPGVLRDLLKVTGCKPPMNGDFTAAEIRYDTSGRARALATHMAASLSRQCEDALRAMLIAALDGRSLSLSRGQATEPHLVFVPLSNDHVSCVDAGVAQLQPFRPLRSAAEMQEARKNPKRFSPPRKTHNVAPVYPPAAQVQRIGGQVVMEATISHTGCVPYVRVLSSPAFSLSFAALDAVSQWRFEPVVLDGVPQIIIYTVTVKFDQM